MHDEFLASIERRLAHPLAEVLARTAYMSDPQLHDAFLALSEKLDAAWAAAPSATERKRIAECSKAVTDQYWSIVILRSENPEIHTIALDRAVTSRIRPEANVIVSFDHV